MKLTFLILLLIGVVSATTQDETIHDLDSTTNVQEKAIPSSRELMPCTYRSWNNKIGCPNGYRCSRSRGQCVRRRKFGGGSRFYYGGGGSRTGRYGSNCHRHNQCYSRICNKRVGRCERLNPYGRNRDYYIETCWYDSDCSDHHDKCERLHSSWGICVPRSGSSWRYYHRRCNCRNNERCNSRGECVTIRSRSRRRRSCRSKGDCRKGDKCKSGRCVPK